MTAGNRLSGVLCDEIFTEVYGEELPDIWMMNIDNSLQTTGSGILNVNELSRHHRIVMSDSKSEDSVSEEDDVDNTADI
jgi:hypothetical protein